MLHGVRAGKMDLSCPLGTTRCVPQEKILRKPDNKSFIDQVCSVKMAGYWPRSFFCEFMDLDFLSVHKHEKKELGQYPAILTSHLVNNPDKLRLYARQPGKALNGLNVVRNFHRISTERFFQPFWQYLMFLEKCRAITKIFVRLQDDKISQLGHSTGKLVSAFNDTSKIHAYIGS